MDAFSYLSVLLSIILGLAITQVLQGVRGLLLARRRVRLYAPAVIWSGLVLVFATQSWWASFGLARHHDWTFPAFGTVLIQTTLLYMLAALVLPDVAPDAPIDLRAHYFREARPFFLILIALLASSVLKDVVIDGHLPVPVNLAFHALFASLAGIAATTRRARIHEALAIISAVMIAGYIALLFNRLA